MSTKSIIVDNLAVHYRSRFGRKIHAVRGVSFDVEFGKVLGVAGESGCGKSTLVNGIMSLFIPPMYHTHGAVVIGDNDITKYEHEKLRTEILGKKISIIPQSALTSLNPTMKIKNFVIDIMKNHEPNKSSDNIYGRLKERFKEIGLDPKVLNAYPIELSGGMKQRVVIGISTLMDPAVVIADEPTSALDVSTQKSVIIMLKDLMKKNIIGSMIFISHELPLLYHVADDIAIMYDGEFVELGKRDQIIKKPEHPYSTKLMTAISKLSPDGERYGKTA